MNTDYWLNRGYITLCLTPMWLTELVPPRQRGALIQVCAVLLGLGYVSANWIGYGFSYYHGKVLAFRPILGKSKSMPPEEVRAHTRYHRLGCLPQYVLESSGLVEL
jgi:hypothetical protein